MDIAAAPEVITPEVILWRIGILVGGIIWLATTAAAAILFYFQIKGILEKKSNRDHERMVETVTGILDRNESEQERKLAEQFEQVEADRRRGDEKLHSRIDELEERMAKSESDAQKSRGEIEKQIQRIIDLREGDSLRITNLEKGMDKMHSGMEAISKSLQDLHVKVIEALGEVKAEMAGLAASRKQAE